MSGRRHPTQAELLRGAIHTLEEVLVPELSSAWARASALGLVGQLRYALARDERDSLALQDAELAACLEALFEAHPELDEIVAALEVRDDPSWNLRARAGAILVHALGGQTAAAEAIREQLRPLLRAHVEQDLAESGPMLHAFLASGTLGKSG